MPSRRPSAAAAIAAAATVLAFASVLHSAGGVWRHLDRQRAEYAPLTGAERDRAPLEAVGVPASVFDFYSAYTVRGDRVYFQVGRGASDRQVAFAAAGRFSLLPATQADDLAGATVVASYRVDPNALGVHFVTRQQQGDGSALVSRIRGP